VTPAIVPRVGWRAREPRKPTLPRPASARRGVVVHFNGPAMTYTTPAGAMASVRAVQGWHMDHMGWSDVAYSYLVDQFGYVYEGRGMLPQFANGADVVGADDGPDTGWFTIMWMGGVGQHPTAAAVSSITSLVESLRIQGCGTALRPHLDFRVKPCPGPELTAFCRRYDGKPFHHPTPKITVAEEAEMPTTHFVPDPDGPYPSTPSGRVAGWLVSEGGGIAGINGTPSPGAVGVVVAVTFNGRQATVVTKAEGVDDFPTYVLGQV
jgi:hypothetical protein